MKYIRQNWKTSFNQNGFRRQFSAISSTLVFVLNLIHDEKRGLTIPLHTDWVGLLVDSDKL